MKVRVVSCKPYLRCEYNAIIGRLKWYEDMIGNEFEVEHYHEKYYLIVGSSRYSGHCIDKSDCIIVEEDDKMVEIIAGVNNFYSLGDGLEVRWEYGEDYKQDDYSLVVLYRNEKAFAELSVGEKYISIEEVNGILAGYVCKVVEEKEKFKITGENGTEVEIDMDRARELGLV